MPGTRKVIGQWRPLVAPGVHRWPPSNIGMFCGGVQWCAACAAGRRRLLLTCGGCHRWPVYMGTLVCAGMYRSLVGPIVSSSTYRQSDSGHGGGRWRPVQSSCKVQAPDERVFCPTTWRQRCVALYALDMHVHASYKGSMQLLPLPRLPRAPT